MPSASAVVTGTPPIHSAIAVYDRWQRGAVLFHREQEVPAVLVDIVGGGLDRVQRIRSDHGTGQIDVVQHVGGHVHFVRTSRPT